MRVSWAEPSDSPLSRTGISRPSASSNATGKGMSIGSLAGWPGVGGVVCSTVMTSWPASAFHCVETATRGVPA